MSGYPTDEELERLISQLEEQELYAPKHMKEQILSQAFPKQTVKIFPEPGRGARTVQTFTYRLKIIAGMAAALIMLMIIPAVSSNREPMQLIREQQDAVENKDAHGNEMFGERIRKIDQRFNAWFTQINSFQFGTLFDMENGGIYNED